MSRPGPVITLAAGAVLAVGLGVASAIAAQAPVTEAAARAPSTAETTAPPTAEATAEATAPAAGESAAPPATGQTSPAPSAQETAAPEPVRTAPRKADYGGRVKGNGGLIAISIRDGQAIGYFCDGRAEAWFKGTESGGELRLTSRGGGRVTAELAGGRARGSVAIGGGKWRFVAPTVVKPSGLYRATAMVRGARLRAGWIVLKNPNGGYTQVGAAFEGETQVPVPRLQDGRPTAPVTVGGATLQPEDVDGFIEELR
ncbi:hypothetical protein [Nonomuraea phyllanthi]|uniref:hypothetical protein n=1 Tax=Nonomuraea phyllanthi TaxID=2219224 RepID=UPI00186AF638|nr:hypothetical protein [Nonomuraea phyllanthi]